VMRWLWVVEHIGALNIYISGENYNGNTKLLGDKDASRAYYTHPFMIPGQW